MITASRLLAISRGLDAPGNRRCFLCGSPCDDAYASADYIKDTFTGFNTAVDPGSNHVCPGCVLAFQSECVVEMIDGSRFTIERGGVRLFSWVITRREALAASKAHMAQLRTVCLSPPTPPYAIILSDSGQTHQIYRGVVGRSDATVALTLEGRLVEYAPESLRHSLEVAGRLAACIGKPGLASPRLNISGASKVIERYRSGSELIDKWSRLRWTPLGRLAAWLTPKKEECELAYPSDLD